MPISETLGILGKFALDTVSRTVAQVGVRIIDKFLSKGKQSGQIVKVENPPTNIEKARKDERLVKAQQEHQKDLAAMRSEEVALMRDRNDIEETYLNMEKAVAIAEHHDRQKAMELQTQLIKLKQDELKLTKRWQDKQEEIARLEREFRAKESALYHEVLRELKAQEIDVKLTEIQTNWDAIEKNWPSRLSRKDTEEILLKGKEQYQLLLLVAPPNINKSCPDSFKDNLPQEIRNRLKVFLGSHYPENSLFSVEFYGDYFNRDIFDIDVKQLKSILAPIPTAVVYCDITDREIFFNIGVWGWSDRKFSQISSPPWNWREEKNKLMSQGEDEEESFYLIRQQIVTVYKVFAAFFADWYYLNLDRNYEPQLFHLESELPEEWVAPYLEILQAVYQYNQAVVCYDEGLRLVELGYHEQALAKFEKALELRSDLPDTAMKRGVALYNCGRYEEAIGCLEKILEWKAESDEAWFYRGMALRSLRRDEVAVSCFEKVIELKPDNAEYWFQWGEVLSALGRKAAAEMAYDKANVLKVKNEVIEIKLDLPVLVGKEEEEKEEKEEDCFNWVEERTITEQLGRIAFSPDGQLIASNSKDSNIKIWSVLTGSVQHIFSPRNSYNFSILSVAFSPDGQLLAFSIYEQREYREDFLQIWSLPTQSILRTFTQTKYPYVYSLAFSPDGKLLATGNSDNQIQIWLVATGELILTITGHSNNVKSVAFSPDGKLLASGSSDKIIQISSPATGALLRILEGHSKGVESIAFSPDGEFLASGSDDATIKIWSVTTGKEIRTLKGHCRYVKSVAFSPDGKLLASGSDDGTIRIWSVATGTELHTLIGHFNSVNSVAFSPDGQLLASGSADNTIKIWRRG